MTRWRNHRAGSAWLLAALVAASTLVGVLGDASTAAADAEWEGPLLDVVGAGASTASGATLDVTAPAGLAPDHHAVVPVFNLNQTAGTTTSVEAPFAQADAESVVFSGPYRAHYAVHETDQDVTGQSPFTISWSAATQGARAVALGFRDTAGVDTGAGMAVGNSIGAGGLALARVTLPEDALAVAFLLQDPGNAPTLGSPWSLVASQPSTGIAVYQYRMETEGATPAATVRPQGSTTGKGFTVFGLLPVGQELPGVPAAPQELAVSAVGDGSVGLQWGAPVDDGGAAVTDYVVQHRDRWAGGAWTTVPDDVAPTTSATVSGLTNYDEYEFRVLAVNEVGAGPAASVVSGTPSDGDDPDETFNHPDGPLSAQPGWTRVNPAKVSDLRIVDGSVEGTGDPDGTGATYTTAVGPNVEVTVDALLGDSYNEVSAVLRMKSTSNFERSYLLQWVTDGDEALQGTVVGPGLQIWRIDAGPRYLLLAEAPLADEGERTLTFGASGSTLYVAEADTVHLSYVDATYPTGEYIALGQANLSGGGTASQIDNMRWEALAAVNLAPVAADGSVSTPEGVPAELLLSASDADGDALSYRVTSGPSGGSLSGSGPMLTYVPNPGFVGSDTFTFVANDGEFDSNPATVSITVTGVVPGLVTWAPSRTGAMRTVDLTRGTSSPAPGLSFGTHAMDRDPATGLLYYFEWNTSGNEFAVWDPSSGSNTTIRTYTPAPGLFVTQMAFAPDGTLYVVDAGARLHTIDPSTGDITTLGPISGLTNGPHGQMGDLAFAPDGTAYVATYGELYTLDIGTRTATLLHGAMFGASSDGWFGLAYCDGTLFGANIRTATGRSGVYSIDVASGAVTLIHQMTTYVTDLTGCAST